MTRLALAFLVLAGCASYDGRSLTPGVSTATEVEAVMGAAAERRAGPRGETVLWYPRPPYASYAARIGADGKLIAVEQRLTRDNVATLKPGASRSSEVRDLLGPPQRIERLARKQVDAWTYQVQSFDPQLIVVEMSPDGVVRTAYVFSDPDKQAQDGSQ